MSSESIYSTPFERVGRVSNPVMEAFDESGAEVEILYCIGIAPWADGGECLVAIGLTTPCGSAWIMVDRFETGWLVLHRSGTAGEVRPIPDDGDVEGLVEECCRFLTGVDPVPVMLDRKLM